jgi:hypothetical protein
MQQHSSLPLIALLLACSESEQLPDIIVEAAPESVARGLESDGYVQSCAPEPGCPADDPSFDPAWCTERSEPFGPTVVDGELVAIDVNAEVGAAIGLAPGTWWAAWRPTDGSCAAKVVTLVVAP